MNPCSLKPLNTTFSAFQDYLKLNVNLKNYTLHITMKNENRAQFVPHLLTVCPQSEQHPS